MAGVRCTDLPSRPTAFRDCTRLTLAEFPALLPSCAAAFPARRAAGRCAGNPRTARPFPVDQPGPLPTPDERLFFRLTSLQTSALPGVQGRWGRLGPSTATPWRPVLRPAWLAARRTRGAAPARARTARARRRGGAAAAAAPGVAALEEERMPLPAAPARGPPAPLVARTGPHGAWSAPKTRRHRRRVRAARKRPTRCTMSCGSRPPSRASGCGRPTAAASMTSGWPRPPRLPSRLGAGGGRSGASWRARSPRGRASCRRRNPAARSGRWSSPWPSRPAPTAGGGSSRARGVSSVGGSSQTGSA